MMLSMRVAFEKISTLCPSAFHFLSSSCRTRNLPGSVNEMVSVSAEVVGEVPSAVVVRGSTA